MQVLAKAVLPLALGKYSALDLGLNDQISSARPAAHDGNNWSAGGSTWFGAGNGSVILYEHDNFEGKARTLDELVGNFDQIGFNDMRSSLIVRRGWWELCTDAEFCGTCRGYRPGEYRSIGPRLNDQFSSARLVGQCQDLPPMPAATIPDSSGAPR